MTAWMAAILRIAASRPLSGGPAVSDPSQTFSPLAACRTEFSVSLDDPEVFALGDTVFTDWLRKRKAAKQCAAQSVADAPRKIATRVMLDRLLTPNFEHRDDSLSIEFVREEARWLADHYPDAYHESWTTLAIKCEKYRDTDSGPERLSLPTVNCFFLHQLQSSGSLDKLEAAAETYDKLDHRIRAKLSRSEAIDLMNASNLAYKYRYEFAELRMFLRRLYYYSDLEEMILNSDLPYLSLPKVLEERIGGMLDEWPWDPDCEESRPPTYEEREFGDFIYKGGKDQWLAARDKCRAMWTACRPVESI